MLYIVFDERANLDISQASVLKILVEKEPGKAYKKFLEYWDDTDAVLVEYDIEDGEAVHPVVIPREEIKTALDKESRPL